MSYPITCSKFNILWHIEPDKIDRPVTQTAKYRMSIEWVLLINCLIRLLGIKDFKTGELVKREIENGKHFTTQFKNQMENADFKVARAKRIKSNLHHKFIFIGILDSNKPSMARKSILKDNTVNGNHHTILIIIIQLSGAWPKPVTTVFGSKQSENPPLSLKTKPDSAGTSPCQLSSCPPPKVLTPPSSRWPC